MRRSNWNQYPTTSWGLRILRQLIFGSDLWSLTIGFCIVSKAKDLSSRFYNTKYEIENRKGGHCFIIKQQKTIPFLKFRRRNETCSSIFGVFQFTLPPVVVILTNNLNDVTNSESDASLFAGNEVILGWIIFELCSYIDL